MAECSFEASARPIPSRNTACSFEAAHAHLLETALLNVVCDAEPVLEMVGLAWALYSDAGGSRQEFVAAALSAVAEDSLRLRLVYTALFMGLLADADAQPDADAGGVEEASAADIQAASSTDAP